MSCGVYAVVDISLTSSAGADSNPPRQEPCPIQRERECLGQGGVDIAGSLLFMVYGRCFFKDKKTSGFGKDRDRMPLSYTHIRTKDL